MPSSHPRRLPSRCRLVAPAQCWRRLRWHVRRVPDLCHGVRQSSRFYPSNLEVIDWLGSYFIEHQVSEKAIMFFERAALIQPAEVKWLLMVASCYRRAGNYQRALAKYKEIHIKFPDNVECEYVWRRGAAEAAAAGGARLRPPPAARPAEDSGTEPPLSGDYLCLPPRQTRGGGRRGGDATRRRGGGGGGYFEPAGRYAGRDGR